MSLLQEIAVKVEEGRQNDVKSLVESCIAGGIPVADILNNGLIAGMNSIGIRFRMNEVFVPEVLVAARAMKAGLEIIRPVLLREKVQSRGTIVMGTVLGDLHDIGKNIVCYMLEGAGYDVVDIGIDAPGERFIQAAKESGAQIIGLSSLLSTTMPYMKNVMDSVCGSDIAGSVKVMIGGAPVTQSFADEIGAHGYAPDAASAVDVVRTLLGQ